MATVVAGGMVAATTVLFLVVRPARLEPVESGVAGAPGH
jgi:hypothetical protein